MSQNRIPGRPRHTAPDGSFSRSVASAGGRGAVLVGVAVVLGIVLLQVTDDDGQAFVADSPHRLTEVGEEQAAVTADDGSTSTGSTTPATDASGSTIVDATTTPPATDSDGNTIPTAAPPNRADITVKVWNGARINGIAGVQSDLLAQDGYVVLDPGNTDTFAQTRIFVAPGLDAACELVRQDVVANNPNADLSAISFQVLDATAPLTGIEGVECAVVLGQDVGTVTG